MKAKWAVRFGVAAIALVTSVLAVPANATVGAMAMAGSGTISPGLTATGYPNTFTFSGEGVVVADTVQGLISCSWTGEDTIGTFTQGAGGFAGSCNDPLTDPSNWNDRVTVNGSFTRTGELMTISATASGDGIDGFLSGVCEWIPTSAPALVSYFDVCNYTIQGAAR